MGYRFLFRENVAPQFCPSSLELTRDEKGSKNNLSGLQLDYKNRRTQSMVQTQIPLNPGVFIIHIKKRQSFLILVLFFLMNITYLSCGRQRPFGVRIRRSELPVCAVCLRRGRCLKPQTLNSISCSFTKRSTSIG
jgi:hypothetical protein